MDRSETTSAQVRDAWEADRSYVMAIALAMLHRAEDAEDVVQEAFARLATAPLDTIEDARGWLVVVTRRLCLDRLGTAEHRRSTPTDAPPERSPEGADPADRLTLDDEVRRALAVVIDRLSPAERTSFILHDVFGFPFEAVATLVGRTPAACRQLARRARQSIGAGDAAAPRSRTWAGTTSASDVADRFIAACAGGDLAALMALLDPAVTGTAHVLGLPEPATTSGAPAVARRILDFFGPLAQVVLEPLALEDHTGIVARRGDQTVAVLRLDHRGGLIHHLKAVVTPYDPAP